jgi:hypothetical protein
MLFPKRGSAVQTRAWMGSARLADICREVRDRVHAADREVTETIRGASCPIIAAQRLCPVRREGPRHCLPLRRRHRPDPEGTISPDNKTARTVPSARREDQRARPQCLFRQIGNHWAGGRRKRAFATRPGPVARETARHPIVPDHRASQRLRNDGERSRPVHPRLMSTEGQYACDDEMKG